MLNMVGSHVVNAQLHILATIGGNMQDLDLDVVQGVGRVGGTGIRWHGEPACITTDTQIVEVLINVTATIYVITKNTNTIKKTLKHKVLFIYDVVIFC